MEFKVKFSGEYGHTTIAQQRRLLGIKDLNEAREYVGVNLPSKRMYAYAERSEHSVLEVFLTEQQAIDSELFDESFSVQVTVPEGALSKFLVPEYVASRDPKTGEITKVTQFWEFDAAQVIDTWMEDGYPIQWDPR